MLMPWNSQHLNIILIRFEFTYLKLKYDFSSCAVQICCKMSITLLRLLQCYSLPFLRSFYQSRAHIPSFYLGKMEHLYLKIIQMIFCILHQAV